MTVRARPWLVPLMLACLAACRASGNPTARPLIVLIGDSTTAGYGGPDGWMLASATPLASLVTLLPETSRWRHAEVVNLGIPASTTGQWAEATTPCPSAAPVGPEMYVGFRLAAHACRTGAPLVDQVARFVGRPVDLALVVLGTNDAYRDRAATPEQAIAHLRTIAAKLAPARVLIASPFWTTDPARAAFVESLSGQLRAGALLTGPDFAAIHLPLDASRVHLTFAGYVASGALWLDTLRALE